MACYQGPRLSDHRNFRSIATKKQELPDSTLVSFDLTESCDLTAKNLKQTPEKNAIRNIDVHEFVMSKGKISQFTPDFKKLAKRAIL